MRKFYAHDAIVVTDPITIECCNNDIVAAGERGTIVDVDPETKDVCVRLSSHHSNLTSLRNMIYLPAAAAKHHLLHYKQPPKAFDYIRLGFGVATAAIILLVASPHHSATAGSKLTTAVSCELPIAARHIENLTVKPITADITKLPVAWVDSSN